MGEETANLGCVRAHTSHLINDVEGHSLIWLTRRGHCYHPLFSCNTDHPQEQWYHFGTEAAAGVPPKWYHCYHPLFGAGRIRKFARKTRDYLRAYDAEGGKTDTHGDVEKLRGTFKCHRSSLDFDFKFIRDA